jgi:hypothetical protein
MFREIFVSLAMLSMASAQTTPVIDLTSVVARNRVREPTTASASGGGVGGDAHVAQQENSVSITILNVQIARDPPHPCVVFEVKLENVGNRSLALPVDPNLADFEPEDADTPYSFTSANFFLVLDLGHGTKAILPEVSLFGSYQVPNSLLQLQPGQSIQIRTRTPLKPTDTRNASTIPAHSSVKVEFVMRQNSVHQKSGSLHQDSSQIAPQVTSSNEAVLALRPQ